MKTSFGTLDILLKEKKPVIEYLIFEKTGRAHIHSEYETFVVLSGSGIVYSGDRKYKVLEGDVVTIPPETSHWMEPDKGVALKGFLWYHNKELKYK